MSDQGDMFGSADSIKMACLLRELGIDAVESAVDQEWVNWTFQLILSWPDPVVRSDQIKAWADNMGWPEPDRPRGWSVVMRRVRDSGLFTDGGMVLSTHPSHHRGAIHVWHRIEQ